MPLQIIEITESPRKNNRFMATLSDGRKIHFGLKHGSTYIDHHDKAKRKAYIKRHYNSSNERHLIDNLTASPSVLALFILWGISTNPMINIEYLNSLFRNLKTS
jgi:hypothetical protein